MRHLRCELVEDADQTPNRGEHRPMAAGTAMLSGASLRWPMRTQTSKALQGTPLWRALLRQASQPLQIVLGTITASTVDCARAGRRRFCKPLPSPVVDPPTVSRVSDLRRARLLVGHNSRQFARARLCGGGTNDRIRTGKWRRRPDLNRGWRFCRPLPYHLATAPLSVRVAALAGAVLGRRWSGKRDSNPRLRPWQGRTLPLSYSRSP